MVAVVLMATKAKTRWDNVLLIGAVKAASIICIIGYEKDYNQWDGVCP